MNELPDHVTRNRAEWDRWAADYEEPGHRNWASDARERTVSTGKRAGGRPAIASC